MDDLIREIEAYHRELDITIASLKLEQRRARLEELRTMMAQPSFWDDNKTAQRISREASGIEELLRFWHGVIKRITDIDAIAHDDQSDTTVTLREEIEREFEQIRRDVASEEVILWLNGVNDGSPAIMTIYSGAGGVDAQDWAMMLERMFLRFVERQGWKSSVLQRTAGQEAGIKNVTLRIEGPHAFGYLKAEGGVHRLVRLSPFDSDQLRHTSFAMVEVLPEIDEVTSVTIGKDDVRVDVFRSSGHGGQSVNTTDSAVRLTHLPTGITVSCQNERSQMQNKAQAWKMLMGKLERYYQAQREEERQLLRGEFTEAAWGNQIRSYVLHPYKMVKDHRTKHESSAPDTVLDGDVMPFIEAELRRLQSLK